MKKRRGGRGGRGELDVVAEEKQEVDGVAEEREEVEEGRRADGCRGSGGSNV